MTLKRRLKKNDKNGIAPASRSLILMSLLGVEWGGTEWEPDSAFCYITCVEGLCRWPPEENPRMKAKAKH